MQENVLELLPTLDEHQIVDVTTQGLGAALPAHKEFQRSEPMPEKDTFGVVLNEIVPANCAVTTCSSTQPEPSIHPPPSSRRKAYTAELKPVPNERLKTSVESVNSAQQVRASMHLTSNPSSTPAQSPRIPKQTSVAPGQDIIDDSFNAITSANVTRFAGLPIQLQLPHSEARPLSTKRPTNVDRFQLQQIIIDGANTPFDTRRAAADRSPTAIEHEMAAETSKTALEVTGARYKTSGAAESHSAGASVHTSLKPTRSSIDATADPGQYHSPVAAKITQPKSDVTPLNLQNRSESRPHLPLESATLSTSHVNDAGSHSPNVAQPTAQKSRIVILSPPSQPDAVFSPRQRGAELELHQIVKSQTKPLEPVSRSSPFGGTLQAAQSVDSKPSGANEKASTRSHLSPVVQDEDEPFRPTLNASSGKMTNDRVSAPLQASERGISIKKPVVIVTSAPTSLPPLTTPLSPRRPIAAAPPKPGSKPTDSPRTMQQVSAAPRATAGNLPVSHSAKPHTNPDV